MSLRISGNPEADALLEENPFALLVGMLLDQQVPMEWAFSGPATLASRLNGPFTPETVAAYDPEELASIASTPPSIHRFPASMARRIHALATQLVADYGGDTAALWDDAETGEELLRRLRKLPGFGEQKARIFLALLGKQKNVRPKGWREAAGPYGADGVYQSVADVVDAESLAQVRAYKQEMKKRARKG